MDPFVTGLHGRGLTPSPPPVKVTPYPGNDLPHVQLATAGTGVGFPPGILR